MSLRGISSDAARGLFRLMGTSLITQCRIVPGALIHTAANASFSMTGPGPYASSVETSGQPTSVEDVHFVGPSYTSDDTTSPRAKLPVDRILCHLIIAYHGMEARSGGESMLYTETHEQKHDEMVWICYNTRTRYHRCSLGSATKITISFGLQSTTANNHSRDHWILRMRLSYPRPCIFSIARCASARS